MHLAESLRQRGESEAKALGLSFQRPLRINETARRVCEGFLVGLGLSIPPYRKRKGHVCVQGVYTAFVGFRQSLLGFPSDSTGSAHLKAC